MAMDHYHSACDASLRDLPPLSPTYQTSPLLTPDNFSRCTVDTAHYRQYLERSLRMDPPDRNALDVRTQLYGDNRFLVHRYTRAHEPHLNPTLQLSDLRPTDDIVAKPMTTTHSEISAPFPAEHPFTSHTSKFAVFPDIHPGQAFPDAGALTTSTTLLVTTGTQTQEPDLPNYRHLLPRLTTPFYVLKKASENNVRVECRHLDEEYEDVPRNRSPMWDLPRSLRHIRGITYPGPVVQHQVHPPSMSLESRQALRSIYHQVMLSTSYAEHFSLQKPLKCISDHRDGDRRSLSTRSAPIASRSPRRGQNSEPHCVGHDENTQHCDVVYIKNPPSLRAGEQPFKKVDQVPAGGASHLGGRMQDSEDHSTSAHHISLSSPDGQQDHASTNNQVPRFKPDSITTGDDCAMQDKATQTEASNWEYAMLDHRHSDDPTCTFTGHHKSQTYPIPALSPVVDPLCSTHVPSSSSPQTYTPRSALIAQRMGALLRFSKTEARRKFHALYPEVAPNLSEHKSHSESERRHIINGYNAYYYH